MNTTRIDPEQFKRLTEAVNAAADAMAKAYAPMLDAIRRDVAHLAALADAKPEPILTPARFDALTDVRAHDVEAYARPYRPGQVATEISVETPAPKVDTIKIAVKRDKDGDLWVNVDGGEFWYLLADNESLPAEFGPYTDVRIEPLTT